MPYVAVVLLFCVAMGVVKLIARRYEPPKK